MILEVSCGSVEEAILAAHYGADRVEICHALSTGGVTPSPGFFKTLRQKISIPIFVMIAQPEANFIANDHDFNAMLADAAWFAENGADGLVFGCITNENQIDIPRNQALINAANGLPCTFHRAFDMILDPLSTAKSLTHLGFTRILTSGCSTTVDHGLEVIETLIQSQNIQILPGGGVRAGIALALQSVGATELHFSIRGKSLRTGYLGYPLPTLEPDRITKIREALS